MYHVVQAYAYGRVLATSCGTCACGSNLAVHACDMSRPPRPLSAPPPRLPPCSLQRTRISRASSSPSRASSPPSRASSPPSPAFSPPSRAASPPSRVFSPPSRTSSPPAGASTPPSRASSPPSDVRFNKSNDFNLLRISSVSCVSSKFLHLTHPI